MRTLSAAVLASLAAGAAAPAAAQTATPLTDLSQVKTIVVIYAENHSFDQFYGSFPGANGITNATAEQKTQVDRNGQVLSALPQVAGGLTDASDPTQVPATATQGHANTPYSFEQDYGVGLNYKMKDMWHRFYQNQMQINGGKNNAFAAWADAGGEVMGHFDGSKMALWSVAQKYTLADNFFQGAFGGSFLNHQYLICACAPYDFKTAADPAKYASIVASVNADGVSLAIDPASPASALNGVPKFVNDAALTPDYYGVNTMQPPYQPSGNAPASGGDTRFADPAKANTLSPQGAQTIGDLLTVAGVDWAWYGGAWQAAVNDSTLVYGGTTQFQPHHQPFNYYQAYAPGTAARTAHLRDGGLAGAAFIADIDAGKLPPVAFYKPQGNLNQHPGYATAADGDAHIADLISHLEKSPQWNNMVVLVTYDEFGGQWDHAAPPKADRWGPGTRIPALIVSPFAKRGFVDHTQYDTASALRLITRRFGLPELPGLQQRDFALISNGLAPMGDLTQALDMPLQVDYGFTGSWYNPAQSGHGFTIEVLPGNLVWVLWNVFDDKGQQAWLAGMGTVSSGSASVAMLQPTGGLFPPNFDPKALTKLPWGTLNFTFSDCGHAHVDWTSTAAGFNNGSLDLVRLTQPAKSPSCH